MWIPDQAALDRLRWRLAPGAGSVLQRGDEYPAGVVAGIGVPVAVVAVPVAGHPVTGQGQERRVVGEDPPVLLTWPGGRVQQFGQPAQDVGDDLDDVLADQLHDEWDHPGLSAGQDLPQPALPHEAVAVAGVQASEDGALYVR